MKGEHSSQCSSHLLEEKHCTCGKESRCFLSSTSHIDVTQSSLSQTTPTVTISSSYQVEDTSVASVSHSNKDDHHTSAISVLHPTCHQLNTEKGHYASNCASNFKRTGLESTISITLPEELCCSVSIQDHSMYQKLPHDACVDVNSPHVALTSPHNDDLYSTKDISNPIQLHQPIDSSSDETQHTSTLTPLLYSFSKESAAGSSTDCTWIKTPLLDTNISNAQQFSVADHNDSCLSANGKLFITNDLFILSSLVKPSISCLFYISQCS